MSQGFSLKTLKIFQVCTGYVNCGRAGYMLVDKARICACSAARRWSRTMKMIFHARAKMTNGKSLHLQQNTFFREARLHRQWREPIR